VTAPPSRPPAITPSSPISAGVIADSGTAGTPRGEYSSQAAATQAVPAPSGRETRSCRRGQDRRSRRACDYCRRRPSPPRSGHPDLRGAAARRPVPARAARRPDSAATTASGDERAKRTFKGAGQRSRVLDLGSGAPARVPAYVDAAFGSPATLAAGPVAQRIEQRFLEPLRDSGGSWWLVPEAAGPAPGCGGR